MTSLNDAASPSVRAAAPAATLAARLRVAAWRWRLVLAATALSALVLGSLVSFSNWYLGRDERLGRVDFPISCGWSSQRDFTHATALLHLFQFADAEAGYIRIVARDPDCAIAYWGVAMSRLRNPLYALPSAGDVEIADHALRSAAAARTATPRERGYVAALAGLFDVASGRDWPARERDYADAMGKLTAAYPQDGEASIFYALALNLVSASMSTPGAERTKAAELLLQIFAAQPEHPGIEHYLTYCLGHVGFEPKPFEKEGPTMTLTQRLLLAALALVALCGAAIFVVFTADFRSGATATNGIGGPFALTAGDGQLVTDRSFRGRWMLIYFGYTNCPNICPTTLAAVSETLVQLGPLAAKVQPIFVSIDPERDTPAAVGEFTKAFDPRIIGLTGKPAEIAAVAKEFRVFYKKVPGDAPGEYAMEHSSYIYVMNPEGRYVTLFASGANPSADEMTARLRELLAPSPKNPAPAVSAAGGTSVAAYSGNR